MEEEKILFFLHHIKPKNGRKINYLKFTTENYLKNTD